MTIPDFLAIGHLCCDLVNGRRILGGSASYAALTACALGRNAGILTAVGDDFPFRDSLQDISFTNIGSPSTTTFRNVYRDGVREQTIGTVARSILPTDIPARLAGSHVVYLCPVANEVDPGVADCFGKSLVGAGAQGWFREWDAAGRVRKKRWESAIRVAKAVDAVIYSELDTDAPYALAEELARHAPIVIVTQSSRGADVYADNERIHLPAFEIREVDPTGAGDVFAAAFLIHFETSGDVVASAKFACCVASFVCEREGTEGIPTNEQALGRLRRYDTLYSESTI